MSGVVATASNRLAGAPAGLLEPETRPTLAEARQWCKALADSHYENFHVATTLLPARLRPHFHAVYAFCRVSDDLGDEVPDRALASELLRTWREMLVECYEEPAASRHPVYVALRESIVACDLPMEPFSNLIRAFDQDQVKTRFESLAELEAYSADSANPVGRLVLMLCGYRDPELFALSDETCTGLQLANFWQDVQEDLLERDRVYLPQDRMAAHGVTEATLRAGVSTPEYTALLKEMVADGRARLMRGVPLIDRVDRELAGTLRLFSAGGLAILRGIERIGYRTLEHRPEVSRGEKLALLLGAALGKVGIHQGSRGLR
ncbi:squalene synthase HpnC [Terriglobus aquaticus]|uniref:Squalene synthase HpnC n=1 Tax=Terriglobus aquaticus TaxID=940139 RepID=A0ABW9KNL6_9BACT|nr:squalene synthase HpnC [Terriglobus aquaticus]